MQSFPRVKDARHFQLMFQSVFLLYGVFFLHWKKEGICFLYYAIACISAQFLFDWIRQGSLTAACVLAGCISIGSKYLLQYRKKHLFNPSAFGIVATILLTGRAWISPGQWGNDIVAISGICCLGCIVVTKVQKLDVSIAFLTTYSLLLFVRQILYLGWPLDFLKQSVTTGSLLLFSFFMISDPKTAPDHTTARIIWAMLTGILAFYLTAFKFINAAPVWALVLSAPVVPLLDKIFIARKFQWQRTSANDHTNKIFINNQTI